jgi:methyl-accepting chemotaxis protein
MKVSTKIVSGIGLFFIISLLLLSSQVTVFHQLQSINRDLAEIDMRAIATSLDIEKLVEQLNDDTRKFVVIGNEIYERLLEGLRYDFAEDLERLRKVATSDAERVAVTRLGEAFDNYWRALSTLEQSQKVSDQLPPDVSNALDHLAAQSEVMYEVIKGSTKDKVAYAAQLALQAQRTAWVVGLLFGALSVILAVLIVRSINEPLRLLTQGVRAISKGHFWYRLPTDGSDEFTKVARDFNLMSGNLVRQITRREISKTCSKNVQSAGDATTLTLKRVRPTALISK